MENLKKLYRMGEITRYAGISRQTLHYYTQLGLLEVAERTPGGQRLYDEGVFAILEKIKKYQRQRLTLLEIKDKLKTDGQLKFPFVAH